MASAARCEGAAIWIPRGNRTSVFNTAIGLNPALLGLILTVWRIYDAVADQMMENISDNARTCWGASIHHIRYFYLHFTAVTRIRRIPLGRTCL